MFTPFNGSSVGVSAALIEWLGSDRYYFQRERCVWRSCRCVGLDRSGETVCLMAMPLSAPGLRIVNAALEIEAICARARLPVATHYVNLTPEQTDELEALASRWRLPCVVIRGERRRWMRKSLSVCTLVVPFATRRVEYDAHHPDRPVTRSSGVRKCD